MDSPIREAQVHAADAIRELSGALVDKVAPAELLDEITRVVEDLTQRVSACESRDLRHAYRTWVLSKGLGWDAVIERPGGGAANPVGIAIICEQKPEGLVAEIMFPEVFASWPGSVFGGAVASIMDDLLGQAASFAIGFSATTRLEIDYRRPTPTRRPLRATARPLGQDGKLFVAEATIHDGDELLVSARAQFAPIPSAGLIF